MTLRDGRADLHRHLTTIMGRMDWDNVTDRAEIAVLLRFAAEAVLRCPHRDCAYCFTVERKEA